MRCTKASEQRGNYYHTFTGRLVNANVIGNWDSETIMSQPFEVTQKEESVRVVLPMHQPYDPIPVWFSTLEWVGMILLPAWLLCSAIIRAIFRIKPPPRAEFVIDQKNFQMRVCAHDTGQRSNFECARASVVEFRKNRLEPGLWIRAKDIRMDTVLQDIDEATIEALSQCIRRILGLGCETQQERTNAETDSQ